MERHQPSDSLTQAAGREPALSWLRATVAGSGSPAFFAGPQAAWALETWLLGGEALAELEDRSVFGDSIAARSLAAVHAAVVALSLAEQEGRPDPGARAPRGDLRGRLLASAAAAPSQAPTVVPSSGAAPASMPTSAVVAVGQKHAKQPVDARRSSMVDRLAADKRDGDAELEKLLERVEDWLDFPLLVVSVVHGGETVHRAYRTKLADPPRVVPREASYCTHCVAGDAPLVVEDARADAFFAQHPAVAAFGLVAYCGVPLRVAIGTPDEAVVGTLCGYDVRARPVLVEDAATLEIFARRAAALIEGSAIAGSRGDAAWADASSRGEEREVYAPGPFLDLALVALRRAQRSGSSALLVGPSVTSVPHGASLVDSLGPTMALAAGRLPDGRSAWLLRERGAGSASIGDAAARLAKQLAAQLDAPVGVSVVDGPGEAPVDVDAWVERAARA